MQISSCSFNLKVGECAKILTIVTLLPQDTCLLDLLVPVFLEEWGHHCRLVLHIEVSQVLILEWVSPAIPDLTVLPPPRDPREEGGISLRAWSTL